jgi:hypothetical protein
MLAVFHAPFNAAFLHTVALAYPDAALSFQAFPAHAGIVRDILDEHVPQLSRQIIWRTVPPPSANSSLPRFLEARRFIRESASTSAHVIFTSISRMQLMHLKRFLGNRKNLHVRAVLHGELGRTGQALKESFPMSLFPLERVLLMPHPAALRYIVLTESVLRNVPLHLQQALSQSAAIEHPYHFPPIRPYAPLPLVFGIFGNTGDGRLLEQVARRVKSVDPSIRFRLVGFLSGKTGKEPVERLRPLVEDVTDRPIPRATYVERAHGISHALWLAPPDSFRLRASGTFLDALAYAKPLIYTANAYIDPYYALEPKIGIRCETVDGVADAVLNTVRTHTASTYVESQQAMERLRQRFLPQQQAQALRLGLHW